MAQLCNGGVMTRLSQREGGALMVLIASVGRAGFSGLRAFRLGLSNFVQ